MMDAEHAEEQGTTARPALDEQEFSISFKGYDRDEVKAYLTQVEASFQELEEWVLQTRAALSIAEERAIDREEMDQAMVAIFDARDRVLESARRRAERIEAHARDRARAEQDAVVGKMITQAEEEARRIIQAALASTEPATRDSILEAARAEADDLARRAHAQADLVVAEAQKEADRLIAVARASAAVPAGEPVSVDLSIDRDGDVLTVVIDEDKRRNRPSRYERTSAKLPMIGEEASKIASSLESIKEQNRPTLGERLKAPFHRRS